METITVDRETYLRLLADMWTLVPREKKGVVFFNAPKYRK